jgi:hypothetical protein
MADLTKQNRIVAGDAIKTNVLAFNLSEPSTTDSPVLGLFAVLALVYQTRTTLYEAKYTAREIILLINSRLVAMSSSIEASWYEEVSTTVSAGTITDDAALIKFFESLGAGGADGPLAVGLADVQQAAFLFPGAFAVQTVTQLVLCSPQPVRLFANLPHVLAPLWGMELTPVIVMMVSVMMSAQAAYDTCLCRHYGTDRSTTLQVLEVFIKAVKGDSGGDGQGFKLIAVPGALAALQASLTRLKPPKGPTAVSLGAVAAPASKAPIAAPAAVDLLMDVLIGKFEAYDRRLGEIQDRRASSSSSSSSAPAAKPKGTVKCYHCGKPGHLRKDCRTRIAEEKVNSSNQKYTASYGATRTVADEVDADAAEAWPDARSLRATVSVTARRTGETHLAVATFDTGAPFSALHPTTARSLGCPVRPYKGPQLRGPNGARLRVLGQTTLANVEVGSWHGPVGPVAIVEDLGWDFLFGLSDMRRAAGLHIDFTVNPPTVQFTTAAVSTTPAVTTTTAASNPTTTGSSSASASPGPVGAVLAQMDSDGVPDTLAAVSRVAAAADAALRAQDAADAATAVPVPASFGAAASRIAKPMIDARSPDEVQYRAAFHADAANAEAYKHVEIEGPEWFQSKVRTLLKRYSQTPLLPSDLFAFLGVKHRLCTVRGSPTASKGL